MRGYGSGEHGDASDLRGYVVAGAAVVATELVRMAMGPVLGSQSPFLLFVLPVVVATVWGGLGPGLAAGFLSLLLGFSFLPSALWVSGQAVAQALIFVLVCAGIGWAGMRLAREHRVAREASEQLRLLLEGASRYAIFMVDPDGKVVTWNSGAERIFGRPAGEMIGKHSSVLANEQDAFRNTMSDLETALSEGRVSREAWLVRSDGSEFLADMLVTPLHGEGGRLRGFAKVIHDVTERRANERALEKREQHLASILATVPDAMIVIDAKGNMISFSPAAERLFGYPAAGVLGRNVNMLMPSPDRERHDSCLERYLETGVPRIIGIGRIVTGLRADGSTFPMKLSVGEALTEGQRLFTGFVEDLTEKKDFEARLEQLKSELIHVSRLSAMGTMASTLAHELNQPLTAIASFGEAAGAILEAPGEPDKDFLREIIGDMAQQSLRAGGIVRRLREFVARGDIAKTVEDLPRLIDEASALALVGSKEKGVTAQFSYDPLASPVLVDRVQIQQVLINLMRNAIEAMDGSPVRRLEVSTARSGDSLVEVSVRDTGPGIAPEIAERLFEAFNSTKRSGMGLGLSICRTIVEAHGGRIQASAADGGGTRFHFTLVRALREDER